MYSLLRPLLFALPPERAHRLALGSLHAGLSIPGLASLIRSAAAAPARPVEAFGLSFANPIGLAAGFDKDARHVAQMAALGFGFIEVGSVTARPSAGNAQPRLFRLPADGALINRMGLNNAGAEATAARLATLRAPVPLFVNVAKSHDTTLTGQSAIDDYVTSVRAVAPHADVLVLNVSCPNAGDGRTFEDPEALAPLLEAVQAAAKEKPLLVKVSPDLPEDLLAAIVDLAIRQGVAGFTATNTSTDRSTLKSSGLDAIGPGGLSGAPIREKALRTVAAIRARTPLPIVGVGGISTGAHARAFLEAGATLVQLYTGFIYGGPLTVKHICAELA